MVVIIAEAVFEPLSFLPTQSFAEASHWSGERKLMLAVLEEAVHTLFRDVHSSVDSRKVMAAAEAWIASDGRRWPFSFVNVCDVVGLDPGYVRRGIGDARRERRRVKATRRSVRRVA